MAIKEKGEAEEDIWMKVVKIDIKKIQLIRGFWPKTYQRGEIEFMQLTQHNWNNALIILMFG